MDRTCYGPAGRLELESHLRHYIGRVGKRRVCAQGRLHHESVREELAVRKVVLEFGRDRDEVVVLAEKGKIGSIGNGSMREDDGITATEETPLGKLVDTP